MVLMFIVVHVGAVVLLFIAMAQHLPLQCPDFDCLYFMKMQLHVLRFLIYSRS